MREVAVGGTPDGVPAVSLRASLATILELSLEEVPEPQVDKKAGDWTISRWLGGLGLGLARVAEPRSFAWAGPWLARIAPPGRSSRYLVMFGVPSGVVYDPAGDGQVENNWIVEGFIIAAADVATARPAKATAPLTTGVVETIAIAANAGEPIRLLDNVRAIAGSGLEGDRHSRGTGTFPSGVSGSALTLIEAEVCESFSPLLSSNEHRRNLVTRGIDLNSLVGHEFTIGRVCCRGVRLCEPCTVVDGYATRPVLRALVHRGGLRADVLTSGTIQTGDEVRTIR